MKALVKLATLFALAMGAGWLSAQTLSVYPSAVKAPIGSYPTVTAIVNGVNNKTVTWSTDGGTIVGTNPCVVNEPCTIGLYSTTASTFHLTATSNANGAVTAIATITFTATPTKVTGSGATGHPRFLLTPSNVASIQAKATSGNPMYQAIRTLAISRYTSDNPNWSWTCNAGSGNPSSTQDVGEMAKSAFYYAQMATLFPSDPTYNWNCYGHDTLKYVMTQLTTGSQTLSGNSWSDNAEMYVLPLDWLMGSGGITTSGDLTLGRQYAAFMMKNSLTVQAGFGLVPPYNNWNSSAQFANNDNRVMGNNYTMTRMLYLTGFGLMFDDTTGDDPALTNTCSATRYQVCPDFTAGSLHAYYAYLVNAMLFRMQAHLEDPTVTQPMFNAAGYTGFTSQPMCSYYDNSYPCMGDGRGGESSEGSWYAYSLYRLRHALDMIHTAGWDDPNAACLGVSGTRCPQLSLGASSWWDLKLVSDLSFLDGFNLPSISNQPAYSFYNTGDAATAVRNPIDFESESSMLLSDSYTGRTDRTNALKWILYNSAYGGPLGTDAGCTPSYYCGFDVALTNPNFSGFLTPIDLMVALPAADPVGGTLPTDPRPALPKELYNGSYNQHSVVRSGWTTSDVAVSYYCSNTQINHEHEACGRYDILSKNEYITHGRRAWNDYIYSQGSANNQNIGAFFNATSAGPSNCTDPTSTWGQLQTVGGQWWQSQQKSFVSLLHSELPAYSADIIDNTGLYNSNALSACPGANDVQKASRSLLWLRATNELLTYDRVTSGTSRDKQNTLIATTNATVAGNVASWPTQSGTQKAYFTSLLPAGINPTSLHLTSANDNYVPGGSACVANGYCEPDVGARITVDAGSHTSSQFLSHLEWGPTAFTPTTATLVQSTSGQAFDGSLTAGETVLVMFMRAWPATCTGSTFPASGATTIYVSDCTPNTTYSITGTGTPATATTDNAGVMTFAATGTGNITFATGGVPTASTPTFSPVAGSYTSAQTVTISTSSAGAILCYTTNGSSPATNGTTGCTTGTLYSGPITVSVTQTVKAIAGGTGWLDSGVGSAAYTITIPSGNNTYRGLSITGVIVSP